MPEILEPPTPYVEEREMATMGLLQHLEELRKRIMISAAAVAICFGASWYKWMDIYRMDEEADSEGPGGAQNAHRVDLP